MYVGTYTKSDSKGIYVFRYDAASGKTVSLGVAAETSNPSFLAADPTHRRLYAVNEVANYKGQTSGAVSAFDVDHKTGKLSLLNETASRGADPCYIALDKTGKFVLVANYTSGNLAVFPLADNGSLTESSAFVQHHGKGINPERQEGPHAHWIETTPDNRFAIAADLGLDELLVYHFDAAHGTLTPNSPPFGKAEAGSGPRHIAIQRDAKFVYAINELNSSVTSFSFDSRSGVLHLVQTVSTLPQGFTKQNDGAEIHLHPNGKFLYASNRGDDSIVVFSVDKSTGHLNMVGRFPTQGKTPRNFEIDPTGSRLLVANEDSNTIVVFQIDGQSGQLSPTGEVLSVPSPVSILFVAQD
jgi:6-phosphogluconolactonase